MAQVVGLGQRVQRVGETHDEAVCASDMALDCGIRIVKDVEVRIIICDSAMMPLLGSADGTL